MKPKEKKDLTKSKENLDRFLYQKGDEKGLKILTKNSKTNKK